MAIQDNYMTIQTPSGAADAFIDVKVVAEKMTLPSGESLDEVLNVFKGASEEADGQSGFVPAPQKGEENKFLRGDGTWVNANGAVSSINGKTGDVTLNAIDVNAVSTNQQQSLTDTAKALARANIGADDYNNLKNVPTKLSQFQNDERFTSNLGTVTRINTNAGLIGGPITNTGNIGLAIKSPIYSTVSSNDYSLKENRQYLIGLDKDGYLSVNVPWESSGSVSVTKRLIGSVTNWDAGITPNFSVNGNALVLTLGSAPSLTKEDIEMVEDVVS